MLSLARTRNGEFLGACALDFYGVGTVHGLDSARDADGRKAASDQWPYFGSKASRKALIAKEEVPMRSCFGGMGKYLSSHLHFPDLSSSHFGLDFGRKLSAYRSILSRCPLFF